MTIAPVSPIAVVAVTNRTGNYEIQTSIPHGIIGTAIVVVAGCRNVFGALQTGLNLNATATAIDATHFYFATSSFSAGYSFGGSVWVGATRVLSSTLTRFDSYLATRVVDKTGDTLFGQYSMTGSPSVLASGAASKIVAAVPGSKIYTVATAKFVLGDNDDFQLTPPRTRTILLSTLEAMNAFGDDGVVVGQQAQIGFGVTSASTGLVDEQRIENFWLPLTRLHDKATLVRATLLFFPGAVGNLTLPTTFPTLQLFRLNPSTDVVATSLAASGAVTFGTPSSAAAYAQTAAVGASGNLTLATLNGGTAKVNASTQLKDASGNLFQVTASGTYAAGAPIPIQAIAPASPAVFYGANTNHSAGDVLSWISTPTNCTPTIPVATGGLTGGLNAGYAQTLVFTPDPALAVIDQSTYVYFLRFTDDNLATVNAIGNANLNTLYTAVRLEFSNITSLSPQ